MIITTQTVLIAWCLSCLYAMYCLANMCYVCLENKNKLITDITSSLSEYKDIIHIISNFPFNLAWLKTKRVILICEICCLRLRKTYRFLTMCLKNSALLQGYVENLNSSTISDIENEAELSVTLDSNIKQKDINEITCEIKLENEEMHADECGPIVEETGDVHMKFEVCFVKEEHSWERKEDDIEEYPMDNNSTASINNEHVLATNKDLNTAAKKGYICPICSKSFIKEINFKRHAQVHTGKKQYKSSRCSLEQQSNLKKLHKCSRCKKCFNLQSLLEIHMQTHNDEKPFNCAECGKCFKSKSEMGKHMRVHTGQKPFKCSECEKCFGRRWYLVGHMRTHTGEKPYQCSECGKCFSDQSNLATHMRVHTGEKPYECSECAKCFKSKSVLNKHMWIHKSEKPFKCSICGKCFSHNYYLVRHMRGHPGK